MYSNDTNSSLIGVQSALFYLFNWSTHCWVGVYLECWTANCNRDFSCRFSLVFEDTKTVMIMSQRNTNMDIVLTNILTSINEIEKDAIKGKSEETNSDIRCLYNEGIDRNLLLFVSGSMCGCSGKIQASLCNNSGKRGRGLGERIAQLQPWGKLVINSCLLYSYT